MKLWSRLCLLLALAVGSISGRQNETTDGPNTDDSQGTAGVKMTRPSQPLNNTLNNATHMVSVNATHETLDTEDRTSHSAEDVSGSTASPETAWSSASGRLTQDAGANGTTVTMVTGGASSQPVLHEGNTSVGYVFLAVMLILIIALCVILFFLRRAARTHSFDLQRPDQTISQLCEPISMFGPVYLDDIDQPVPNDHLTTSDISPPPAVNGTCPQSEGKDAATGKDDPQESEGQIAMETPPSGQSGCTPSSDPLSSTELFLHDPVEPQQSEDNRPSVYSCDAFVDINLDEPEWYDQLLASTQAPPPRGSDQHPDVTTDTLTFVS